MSRGGKVAVWGGRGLSALAGFMFLMSAAMKFSGGPQLTEGMEKMGLPTAMAIPLGVVELVCALVYLIPVTSVLGAILLTGYLGGAILAHWRIGDQFVVPVVLGVVVWLGIALRDRRLWKLIPVRRPGAADPAASPGTVS